MGSGEVWEKYHLAKPFLEAIRAGHLDPALAADKARRVLRVMAACGIFDPARRPAGARNNPKHQATARRIAQEATALLKHDGGVLPLRGIRRLLVVGANANIAHHAGGFSCGVRARHEITPLEGLRQQFGADVEITHISCYPDASAGMELDPAQLSLADEKTGTRGLTVSFFDKPWPSETPVCSAPSEKADLDWSQARPFPFMRGRDGCARYQTRFTPASTGTHRFLLLGANCASLAVDGRSVTVCCEAGGADVRLTLPRRPFSYWDEQRNAWHVEAGSFTIWVGASSRDLKLKGTCRR